MTIAQLASQLAKREGKKSQARIGDIRELLKLIVQLEIEHFDEDAQQDGPLIVLRERTQELITKRAARKFKAKVRK